MLLGEAVVKWFASLSIAAAFDYNFLRFLQYLKVLRKIWNMADYLCSSVRFDDSPDTEQDIQYGGICKIMIRVFR